MNYDSILTATDSNVINKTEFYRVGASLPDVTVPMAERMYVVSEDGYVMAAMVLAFFVLAAVLYNCRTMFSCRLKDFFTTKRQYAEEQVNDNGGEAVGILLLTLIGAFSVSVIYFNDIVERCSEVPVVSVPYWLYAVGILVFLCFVGLKSGLYALVNWVFFDKDSSKRWMQGYVFVTALTAFCFYPIALVETYSNSLREIVTASVILVVLLYEILMFYKLLANFKKKKGGYLLFFLYFCSIEMLPALVVWDVAMLFSGNIIVKNLLY